MHAEQCANGLAKILRTAWDDEGARDRTTANAVRGGDSVTEYLAMSMLGYLKPRGASLPRTMTVEAQVRELGTLVASVLQQPAIDRRMKIAFTRDDKPKDHWRIAGEELTRWLMDKGAKLEGDRPGTKGQQAAAAVATPPAAG